MSKEARIEQITKEGAPTVYQIWDSLGYTVVLNAEEALLVLDFLHRNLGELTREVNDPFSIAPGETDHETIEGHLQELDEQEYRQAEGEY